MSDVRTVCAAAQSASPTLARTSTSQRNAALAEMATRIDAAHEEILAANAEDLNAAVAAGLSVAMQDRLRLDPDRLLAIAGGLRALIDASDPLGRVVRGFTLPNGLDVRQITVPLGVIAMVYEGRPNVTVDAAGLSVKSGNACVLRGSSSAINSNTVFVGLLRDALVACDLPADCVCLIGDTSHDSVKQLGRARGLVDLLIPRGGAGLIRAVVSDSQVPVIETGVGNCHVYVDRAADLAMAVRITTNAKAQRPSVCNAAETLLVHRDIADDFLPQVAGALHDAGVVVRGDEATRTRIDADQATPDDWDTEYLDLTLAVAVVDDLDAALDHIAAHGTRHTEAIVTEDRAAARRFVDHVDAAAVMVNASTRFTDGGEFGFGAEIGISTQKLHARGPMGLAELTTTKYVVEGDGQVRH